MSRLLYVANDPLADPDSGPVRRVQMTAEQLRFVGLWVLDQPARAGVSIEEQGKGYLEVVVWDKTNIDIARRTVSPSDNSL